MKLIFIYCKYVYKLSKKYFYINLVYTIIGAVAWITINYALKLLTETITAQQTGDANILMLAIPILLFFLFAILLGGNFSNLEQIITIKFVRNSMKALVNEFSEFESKIKHDLFYDSEFHGEYSFAKNGQAKIIEVTTLLMNRFFISIFNLILPAITIMYFDIVIFAYLSFVIIVSFSLNNYISKKKFTLEKELIQADRETNYFGSLLSARETAKEIRVYKQSDKLYNRWFSNFIPLINKRVNLDIKGKIFGFFIGTCEFIMNYAFIAYLFYLISIEKINPGDAVFLQGTFWVLSYGINTVIELISKNIMESKKYIVEYNNFFKKYNSTDIKKVNPSQTDANDSFISLEVKNVSYRYPGESKYALKNVNLKINAGEVVCLIGENGSGKSTLSKVICGLLEDYSGEILINNKNIKSMNKEDIFNAFGIAFQEFNKYAISLKENIMIGDLSNFNDMRYEKVINHANLKPVISDLPKGDETILGKEYDETGHDVSIGQWQRIILGRSYIKSPKILILDEPTASIDPKEEMRIISSFNNAEINIGATLLITHRIGFAKISHKLYVMKKGKIIESGSHDDLLSSEGEYNKIYYNQKHLYE